MQPHEMDPFTTIYRTYGTRSSLSQRKGRVYHLDPECPFLKGKDRKKGRLGAQLAAGRVLCQYEEAGFHANRYPHQLGRGRLLTVNHMGATA